MLMTILFWAVNLSMIKIGLRDLSPHGFNAIRLSIAALAFLLLLAVRRQTFRLTRGDGWRAVGLGILGIAAYQVFFIQGISRTNASTTSILLGTSPIFIALLSTALGQERIHWAAWLGIAISFAGCLVVVSGDNGGLAFSWRGLQGVALILVANLCWAAYTVFSKPVLDRNPPFKLAALSTVAGTILYLPFALRDVAAIDWHRITWEGWGAILYSGLISIVLCFAVWYHSLRKVGSAKTGIYSNLTPIFASAFAVIFLGEDISGIQAAGAAIVLAGVYLTRSGTGSSNAGPRPRPSGLPKRLSGRRFQLIFPGVLPKMK
jgi:drug/metabolite transporter (DMT)-like permease